MTDERPRCASLTASGARCKNPAAPGGELCKLHASDDYTIFSDEVAAQIVAMLRAGNRVNTAARAAGISRPTFGVWMRRGARGEEPYRTFRDQVEQARASSEALHVTQIAAAAGHDWRAASWMLDRQLGPAPEQARAETDELAAKVREEAQHEARETLEAIGEDPGLSAGAIERYAEAMVVWRTLEAHWIKLGRPGTTLGGATGYGQVAHPLVAQIVTARREAAALAQALGLDPKGRARLSRRVGAGRPQGAASAPDRAQPPRRTLRAVQ